MSPPRTGRESELASRLRGHLDDLLRESTATVCALSVSASGESVHLVQGRRWADGPEADVATQLNMASVSKLLTAAKVLSLVHEGRLSLDDAVGTHLSGVSLLDREGTNRATEITVRQLLGHRGGVPHQPGDLDPASVGSSWSDPALLTKLTSNWTLELAAEPGSYAYSNVGYALLAAIVERIEEQSFAEVMRAYLGDIGMDGSSFWPTAVTDTAAHGRDVRDGEEAFLEPGWFGSRYAIPFSGLWASAHDMVRFGQLLVLAAEDEEAALHPMTEGDSGHGLGPVFRRRGGARSIEHDGGGPGFVAWLVVVPDEELVVTLACNADGETRRNVDALIGGIDAVLETLE